MKKIEFLIVICIFLSFFAAFHPSMNDYLNKENKGTFNSLDQIQSSLDSPPFVMGDFVLFDENESETQRYDPYQHYESKRLPDKAYLIH